MSDQPTAKLPRWKEWGVLLGIFAATVFGGAILGKIGTRGMNVAAGLVVASGTATLAVITRRYSGLPRWASAVSAGILAASAIGCAALSPDVARWHHAVSGSLWMHPWYFLTLVSLPASGSCACSSRAGAWMMIGGAFLIAVIVPAITVLL